jgi:hypothetical protein
MELTNVSRFKKLFKSWDSLVGIATGYGFKGPNSIVSRDKRLFPPLSRVQTDSEAYPTSHPTGTEGLSSGVKRSEGEADYSPSFSSEVKSYTSTPIYAISQTMAISSTCFYLRIE